MKSTNTMPVLRDPDYLLGVEKGETVLVPAKHAVAPGSTRELDPSEPVRVNGEGALVRPGGGVLQLGGSAGLTAVVYDGSNRVTSFTLRGVDYTVVYSAGEFNISASNGLQRRVLLDGNTRISGVT